MKKKTWDVTVKDNPNKVVMGENDEFYTSDTEAYLIFNLQDKFFRPRTATLTLENRNDGSLKSEEIAVVDGVIEWEMPQRYIEHFGNWQGQLVYEDTKDGQPELYTSATFSFVVNAHIGDKKKPSLVEIENWEKFIRDGTELIETWEDVENLRQANEAQRQANYQELLDTGVLQTNINTKLEALEEEYAPKLTEVTAQLAQKVGGGKLATANDLDEDLLNFIHDGTGGPISVESVPKNYSVTQEKTTFSEKVILSNNLVDPTKITEGYTLNANTGEPIENNLYNITGFIKVEPQTTYRVPYTSNFYEFDANQNYIGYEQTNTFTTEDTAAYVRLRISAGSSVPFQLNEGELKKWDEFQSATKIRDLILNEERIKGITFPSNELKEGLKVTEKNFNFLYRNSPNLFNKDTVTENIRLSTSNAILNDTNNTVSDYILVKPNTTYSVTEGSYTHFYNADKEFIVGHGVSINTFTTTQDTAYIRITVRKVKLDVFMLIEGSNVPSESDYVPFDLYAFTENIQVAKQVKPFEGLSLAVNGDSIASRSYFSSELKNRLGFADVTNYAIGGTAYAVRPEPWDTNAISLRYDEMDDNHDVIVMWAGTNDFSNSSVILGEMSDRGTDTFYGALHTTFNGMVEKYPTKKLAVFTMPPRYDRSRSGETVYQYADAIMEVAGYYSIPSCDVLRNSQLRPWNEDNKTAYITDGLHPNVPEGYDLILPRMIEFLKTI